MHILQVSPGDIGGGAEKVGWNLFTGCRERGHPSWLAVRAQHSSDPDVVKIPRLPQSKAWATACWLFHGRLAPLKERVAGIERLCSWLRDLARGWQPAIERRMGHEDFNFPGSHRLLQLPPCKPDIVHCHNLHGGYFDLRLLPWLSQQVPVIATLHDAWLLSGHCAHSFDCELWRTGCGHCPDLTIYPAILRDATAYNWRRKQRIYEQSRLYVSTPCQWLMKKVDQSILAPNVIETRVIPNGVNLNIFRPSNKQIARAKIGLPSDIPMLLFTANSIQKNIWKDYQTMQAAVAIIAEQLNNQRLLFVALGEDAPSEQIGQVEIQFVPYQADPAIVARYYQAADIYIHAARAEVWGLTITEALACGIPVVATEVGGIPEQINDNVSGFLIPPGDSKSMADRIIRLLTDKDLRQQMGKQAAEIARDRFDLNRQVDDYLAWYQEILDNRQNFQI
ncbi:glycosyltransferase [candidate division KSB1 bacterium]|nr:MAG: glycosyltransferase [candidate division KSB1 bacterium]MBC6946590.1 glycosyltransferase [candidate division KSB1 bacterium]MCE7940185.1 glycosyltransferase [Chlorobi bacterium CHB1]MDL1873854.1 glycosyltransferase [Cytophagia bacterium CHB2]